MTDETPLPAYYEPLGDGRYRSTAATQGAWNDGEQHMGPVSGLLVHELTTHLPRPEMQLSRVTFDILGVIDQGEVQIRTQVLRPGRTIELLQADLTVRDRLVVRATAWRLASFSTETVAEAEDAPMLPLSEAEAAPAALDWPGGYIRSLEVRSAGRRRPGRSATWLRSRTTLLQGIDTSDTVALFCLIDTANGLAARLPPHVAHYPNTDLTVHLFREPVGSWVGLDTAVSIGATGLGMTSAALHDVLGPFGRSLQTLTVRLR